MRTFDIIVFLVYLIGITLFGSSFLKKNKSSSAFTLGNSNIPGWVIAMSIFATYVSSISFLALPGNAYLTNWNAFVFSLSIPIALWMAVKYFVPLYRKINSPSAYTFLENRFGPWARVYASACYLLTQVMRVGTILYLLALALHAIVGWDIITIIIITGFMVTIYSLLGGFQAVVWTDAIQGIILIAGALVCAVYLLFNMPEGPGQLFTIAAAHHKFSLGSFGSSLSEPTFWVVLIYGIFINLQNYGIDQNYVQRYMASRTEREAKRSAFWGGMIYVPVSALFIFIGTALFSFYHSGAAALPAGLQQLDMSDRIFPYFIVTQLPAGVTGLLIASVFAAGMSTISTSFNSSATVFLTDYYKRYSKAPVTEKKAMRILYLSSLVISIVGMLVAIAMINVKSALDTWWKLASIFSGGMLGLFLLAAFSRITRSAGALMGIVAGVLVILWLSISPLIWGDHTPAAHFHSFLTIVFGTVTIFFIGFFASVLFQTKQEANNTDV
ncbi:MAG TPA: sodium:solute symporter [Chitinophagaceae bacterium]|nr:sodium:solute symporter [Chitinophagaceae bacterium]